MKRYIKEINGKKVYKTREQIVITKDGMNIYNPTEEMIFADGWEEYSTVEYVPSEEELLQQEQKRMVEDILRYDSSEDVNIFYVQDIPIWLDKATRSGLMLRLQAENIIGITETSLWYNNMEFKLPVSNATQMLYAIEVYASKCYDNTQYHIAEVYKLKNIDDIRHYDYKVGYPEYLRF